MGGWRAKLLDSEMDSDRAGNRHKFQKGKFLLDMRKKTKTESLRIVERMNKGPVGVVGLISLGIFRT